MLIRDYQPLDAEATLDVFRHAIRVTASRDYSPEQIAAWAPGDTNITRWAARRAAARTVVATLDDRVVGFTDLDDRGYIDMMFVDPNVAGPFVPDEFAETKEIPGDKMGIVPGFAAAHGAHDLIGQLNGFGIGACHVETSRGRIRRFLRLGIGRLANQQPQCQQYVKSDHEKVKFRKQK